MKGEMFIQFVIFNP